jgi:hypothetical protein
VPDRKTDVKDCVRGPEQAVIACPTPATAKDAIGKPHETGGTEGDGLKSADCLAARFIGSRTDSELGRNTRLFDIRLCADRRRCNSRLTNNSMA